MSAPLTPTNPADSLLGTLLTAQVTYKDDERLTTLGYEMFRMYTEMGFPPDMFMSELEKRMKLPLLAKVYITSIYQANFLEHRRKSGIEEKNIEKLRGNNREDIQRLITKGEIEVY